MSAILANRIRTPDGTILQSFNQHDFCSYIDKNGKSYAVDGGVAYLRRVCDSDDYEELSVFTDDPFEVQREAMHWGTYGINGDQPLKYIALKDLDTEHIKAILRTQIQVSNERRYVFYNELKYRELGKVEFHRHQAMKLGDVDAKHKYWKEAIK